MKYKVKPLEWKLVSGKFVASLPGRGIQITEHADAVELLMEGDDLPGIFKNAVCAAEHAQSICEIMLKEWTEGPHLKWNGTQARGALGIYSVDNEYLVLFDGKCVGYGSCEEESKRRAELHNLSILSQWMEEDR